MILIIKLSNPRVGLCKANFIINIIITVMDWTVAGTLSTQYDPINIMFGKNHVHRKDVAQQWAWENAAATRSF